MKRIITVSFLPWLLLSATGCLHEQYDYCPTENVSLEFFLDNGNGGCEFLDKVSGVDLAVYDDGGDFIQLMRIPEQSLATYKGVKMNLPEGLYHVIAWGNIGDKSTRNGVDSEHPWGPHVTYHDPVGIVGSSDKVFYAPIGGGRTRAGIPEGAYTMNVDAVAGHSGVLEFTPAHRTLRVYVEGYEGSPEIEITNLPQGLVWNGMTRLSDGSGEPLKVKAVQVSEPLTQNGTRYEYGEFDTFWFDRDNDISVNLLDPVSGEFIHGVVLNDVIEEQTGEIEIVISILFKFGPAGIEAVVPDWEREGVDPGVGV